MTEYTDLELYLLVRETERERQAGRGELELCAPTRGGPATKAGNVSGTPRHENGRPDRTSTGFGAGGAAGLGDGPGPPGGGGPLKRGGGGGPRYCCIEAVHAKEKYQRVASAQVRICTYVLLVGVAAGVLWVARRTGTEPVLQAMAVCRVCNSKVRHKLMFGNLSLTRGPSQSQGVLSRRPSATPAARHMLPHKPVRCWSARYAAD